MTLWTELRRRLGFAPPPARRASAVPQRTGDHDAQHPAAQRARLSDAVTVTSLGNLRPGPTYAFFAAGLHEAIHRAPTSASSEARALYLEALSTAGGSSDVTLDLLERALGLDNAFAMAHALKAMVHAQALVNTTMADAGDIDARDRHVALAREHAQRAAELDDAFAWLPDTIVALYVWDWSPALAVLDSAPDPLDFASILLYSYDEQHDKAIDRARQACALDPGNAIRLFTLAAALAYAHRFEESEHAFRDAFAAGPTMALLRAWLAFVQIALGQKAAATVMLERAEQLLAQNRQIVFLPELAYAYSRIGAQADVERILAELEQMDERVEFGCGGRAMLCLARGDRAGLIEQLGLAIEKIGRSEIDEGIWSLMNIRMNVSDDPVLEEPEIARLRRRLRGR